jgi:hypothetical protein
MKRERMVLGTHGNRLAAGGAAVLVAVLLLVLGYRAMLHKDRIASLNRDVAQIQQLNRRDRAMAVRLKVARADLKAQFLSTMTMRDLNLGNASAAASLMSTRLDRLEKHIRGIDAIVLKARSVADHRDKTHIRRDTTIALNRRVHVSELLAAMKAVFDDFRANPYAAYSSGASASEIGRQLGHSGYALSKSLQTIADDFERVIERRTATAAPLRQQILRLERGGLFSGTSRTHRLPTMRPFQSS